EAMRVLIPITLLLGACNGIPCSSQNECPAGAYCSGLSHSCRSDCTVDTDCPNSDPTLQIATCNSKGTCKLAQRAPKLRVLDPENDTLLPEGTRSVRISGEIQTAAESVTV